MHHDVNGRLPVWRGRHATGLNALDELHRKLRQRGKWLVLAGAHTQPLITMQRDGFIDRLGPENACENIDEALRRARALIAVPPGG